MLNPYVVTFSKYLILYETINLRKPDNIAL